MAHTFVRFLLITSYLSWLCLSAPIPRPGGKENEPLFQRAYGKVCSLNMRSDHQDFCRENEIKFVFQKPNDKNFDQVDMTLAETTGDKVPAGTQCDHFVELQWIERKIDLLPNGADVCNKLNGLGTQANPLTSSINLGNNLYFVDTRVNQLKLQFFRKEGANPLVVAKRTVEIQEATSKYLKAIKELGYPQKTAEGIVKALNTHGNAKISPDVEADWLKDLNDLLETAIAKLDKLPLPKTDPANVQTDSAGPKRCRSPSSVNGSPPPKVPKSKRQTESASDAQVDSAVDDPECSSLESSGSTSLHPTGTLTGQPMTSTLISTASPVSVASSALMTQSEAPKSSVIMSATSSPVPLSSGATKNIMAAASSSKIAQPAAGSSNAIRPSQVQSPIATAKLTTPSLSQSQPKPSSLLPSKVASKAAPLAVSTKRVPSPRPSVESKPNKPALRPQKGS